MRDEQQRTLKIELLSQWKLEAEFRNFKIPTEYWFGSIAFELECFEKGLVARQHAKFFVAHMSFVDYM